MSQRTPIEVFPPGEFIRDELEARGWTQDVLAEILGKSPRLVSEIITGKRAITPETAQALGEAFDTGALVWMNLESTYRLARVPKRDDSVARRARVYGKAPVREMLRRGWIEPSDNVEVLEKRVLDFLEISSLDETPRALQHVARKSLSLTTSTPAQCAWLFRAKRLARAVTVRPFTEARLNEGFTLLRALLRSSQDIRRVPAVLSEAGVRLIILEHLPQTRIDGAAFLLDRKSPVVVLSLRYDRIDSFWHTLIHELKHIANGDIGQDVPVLMDSDLVGERATPLAEQSAVEQRANSGTAEFLVPQAELDDFIARVRPLYSKQRIVGFASRVGVHPGVVVGQLQHRGEIPWTHSREMLEKVRGVITDAALTDGWGHMLPPSL